MENKRIDFNLIIGFLLIGLLLFLMQNSLTNNSEPKDHKTDRKEELDPIAGCMDETACNFSPDATDDDGSCEYPEENADCDKPNSFDKTNNAFELKDELEKSIDFGESIISTLKNEKVELIFSNYCGCFIEASLIEKETDGELKYQNWDKPIPVKLIDQSEQYAPLKFNNYTQFTLKDTTNSKIVYHHKSSGIQLIYVLDDSNKLNLTINNIPSDDEELTINWNVKGPRQEKNLNTGWTSEREGSSLYYANDEGDYDYLHDNDDELDDDDKESLKWIAYKQQFFSTILFAENSFYPKSMNVNYKEDDTDYVKQMNSALSFDNNLQQSISIDFYFAPNDFSYLSGIDTGSSASFDNLIPLGWGIFGWVNEYLVIPVFDFLESLGLGYGLIILAIAIIFKMLLFFPTKKSYVSMAKMRVLKPEIDALTEKYKDKDPMEKQRATMDLYKRTGVSPLGGCLPMLLQIPILFALFNFFPASIQLRQEGFLWASDLSTYDTWPFGEFGLIPGWFDHLSLFALLMSVSTLVQMRFNSQPSNAQMPQMKYIMYIMPVVFFFIMNSYSSGLSYYYLCANIMTFLQQLYIKRGLNDEQLYRQLQENKKKPIKKSGFQKRLEEMAKKQQAKKRR